MLPPAPPLRQNMILSLQGGLVAESVNAGEQDKCTLKGAGGVILLDHRARRLKHAVQIMRMG